MKAHLGIVAAIAMSIPLGPSVLAQAPSPRRIGAVAKWRGGQTETKTETTNYVRPADKGFAHETKIRLQQSKDDALVTSITQRSDRKLTLVSRFDPGGQLHDAVVTIDDGEQNQKQVATVTVSDGKARVARDGKPAVVLEGPRGVIVTSTPDWTDAFLIVRRYDPRGSKEQSFEGL